MPCTQSSCATHDGWQVGGDVHQHREPLHRLAHQLPPALEHPPPALGTNVHWIGPDRALVSEQPGQVVQPVAMPGAGALAVHESGLHQALHTDHGAREVDVERGGDRPGRAVAGPELAEHVEGVALGLSQRVVPGAEARADPDVAAGEQRQARSFVEELLGHLLQRRLGSAGEPGARDAQRDGQTVAELDDAPRLLRLRIDPRPPGETGEQLDPVLRLERSEGLVPGCGQARRQRPGGDDDGRVRSRGKQWREVDRPGDVVEHEEQPGVGQPAAHRRCERVEIIGQQPGVEPSRGENPAQRGDGERSARRRQGTQGEKELPVRVLGRDPVRHLQRERGLPDSGRSGHDPDGGSTSAARGTEMGGRRRDERIATGQARWGGRQLSRNRPGSRSGFGRVALPGERDELGSCVVVEAERVGERPERADPRLGDGPEAERGDRAHADTRALGQRLPGERGGLAQRAQALAQSPVHDVDARTDLHATCMPGAWSASPASATVDRETGPTTPPSRGRK